MLNLDLEYWDPNKSTYMYHETKDEVVINVTFSADRMDEVTFSFSGGKLTVQGQASFEKRVWGGSRQVSERRTYPAFTHAIPIDVPVDIENAKASLGEGRWTLRIPKKPPEPKRAEKPRRPEKPGRAEIERLARCLNK